MQKDSTDITFVLDRSGSMASIQDDTIGGFNTFLEDQKKVPGIAKVTLNQFDNIFETVIDARDIKSVEPLTAKTYVPRGMTALLDAVGRSIVETGNRLDKIGEAHRPGNVLFVIITDGLENASHEYKQGQIRTMVEHQRDKYNWQFIFLGANIDAFDVGQTMGFSSINTMTFAANTAGTTDMMRGLSNKVASYRTTNSTSSLNYDDKDYEEQKKAGANYSKKQ